VRRGNAAFVPAPGWPASSHPVRAIWADAEGVVVGDGDVIQVSTGDGNWREIGAEVGLGGEHGERIDGVLRDREGTLWIRSVHHRGTLRRGAAQVSDLSGGRGQGQDSSGVNTGMAIMPWGEVLVGSERGVHYRRGGHWQLLDAKGGTPIHEARSMFVDRE